LVVYIIYISLYFLRLAKQSQFIPLQNVVYLKMLNFLFVKYSHFAKMVCYYLNANFQGQTVNNSNRNE